MQTKFQQDCALFETTAAQIHKKLHWFMNGVCVRECVCECMFPKCVRNEVRWEEIPARPVFILCQHLLRHDVMLLYYRTFYTHTWLNVSSCQWDVNNGRRWDFVKENTNFWRDEWEQNEWNVSLLLLAAVNIYLPAHDTSSIRLPRFAPTPPLSPPRSLNPEQSYLFNVSLFPCHCSHPSNVRWDISNLMERQ